MGHEGPSRGDRPRDVIRQCAESARQIRTHTGEVLFGEYGTLLWHEDGKLVLNVLCGGVGQYGVQFVLNDAERERYKRQGDTFIKEFAEAFAERRRHTSAGQMLLITPRPVAMRKHS